jgi:AraC-like DNA-binding protein
MTGNAQPPSADRDRLRGILDLVEGSLDEPDLDGTDLAGRAYLSRFHFDRLVRAALGEPPGTFRRRVLLERAAHRLTASDDKVIDVALDAGYASPEAFSRAFVRAYGVAPTDLRRTARASLDLPAPSGIHFHPPGSLRLPAETRSSGMDVLLRMIDHHIWLTGQILDRMDGLGDEVLDRPIELSVEGIDEAPTLRSIADRLVGQLEMWVGSVSGATAMPPEGDRTPAGLRRRLQAVTPPFQELVVGPHPDLRRRPADPGHRRPRDRRGAGPGLRGPDDLCRRSGRGRLQHHAYEVAGRLTTSERWRQAGLTVSVWQCRRCCG